MWKNLSVTCGRSVVFSTNKTDHQDITKILLKVALTITPYNMTGITHVSVSKHLVSRPFNFFFFVGVLCWTVGQVCSFNVIDIWLKVKLLFLSMMVCTRTGFFTFVFKQVGNYESFEDTKGVIRNCKSKNKKTMIHKILCFNRLYQTYYM